MAKRSRDLFLQGLRLRNPNDEDIKVEHGVFRAGLLGSVASNSGFCSTSRRREPARHLLTASA